MVEGERTWQTGQTRSRLAQAEVVSDAERYRNETRCEASYKPCIFARDDTVWQVRGPGGCAARTLKRAAPGSFQRRRGGQSHDE